MSEELLNEQTTQSNKPARKKWYKDFYFYFAMIMLFVILFKLNFSVIMVHGDSMEPNYHSDELLLGKNNYNYIDRFDVVVINSSSANKILIKRVIGLPGETVEYKDNKLYINNTQFIDLYNYDGTEDFKITLDNNSYFCLGDNRDISADSRYYGPFNESEIFSIVIERSVSNG